MPPAARLTDFHTCPMVTPGTPPVPHVGGPVSGPGVPTVMIGFMPAAVVGDMCVCVGPPDSIVKGSATVRIGGRPAARMGDRTAHGGVIVLGCPTVMLVNQSLISSPEHAQEAARLRQSMDEVENMRCAKHVYLANDDNAPADLRDNPPPGFIKPTEAQLEEMGLDQDMLTPTDSQFRAGVYMKDPAVWGANPQPPAVISFRGSTPEKEDWDNNFAQGLNSEAPYYERAVHIGNKLAQRQANVQIVGHSLGGGLASAAQGGSGLNASTYNAAGLHPKTVARYSTDKDHMAAEPDKIAAYRIKGEVLTKTQESLWGSKGLSLFSKSAVGTKHDLEPAHDEAYFKEFDKVKADKNDTYDGYLHGMDQVIAATETQKEADEKLLKNCLGKSDYPPIPANLV